MSKITYIILFAFFLLIGMPSVISQTIDEEPNHHTSKKSHLKWNYDLQNMWAEKKTNQKRQSHLTYFKLRKNISELNLELLPFEIEEIWSENIILVYLKKEIDKKDVEQFDIIAFAPYEPQLKYNPLLISDSKDTHTVYLLISTIKNLSETELIESISPLNGKISNIEAWKNEQIWEIEIPENKISELANIPFIKYIQEVSTPEPINNHAIGFTNSRWANNPISIGGHGLLGKGVTIGVGDNADPLHIDF